MTNYNMGRHANPQLWPRARPHSNVVATRAGCFTKIASDFEACLRFRVTRHWLGCLTDMTAWAAEAGGDTWVFPLVQLGPVGVRQEEAATEAWLRASEPGSTVVLSSPYLNLTRSYRLALRSLAQAWTPIHTVTRRMLT